MDLFKSKLNNKQARELQQNMFEMKEAFKFYFYSNEIAEAEAKLEQMVKFMTENNFVEQSDIIHISIYKADILMVKKQFKLAEQEYLGCLSEYSSKIDRNLSTNNY